MSGRHTRPLFDLISERRSAEAPPRRPLPAPEPTPASAPSRAAAREHAEELGASGGGSWLHHSGTVAIPMNGIYVGAAVLIALLVVVWVAGNKAGASAKERELQPLLQNAVRPEGDPLVERPVRQPETSPITQQPTGSRTGTTPGPGPVPIPGTASVFSAKGPLAADPRQPGLNYYVLERLPREESERVLAFLDQNNFQAFATVDRSGRGANNPPLYRIIALPGITGEQYRTNDAQRRRVQDEAARLGGLWRNNHRGSTSFARPVWEKFESQ